MSPLALTSAIATGAMGGGLLPAVLGLVATSMAVDAAPGVVGDVVGMLTSIVPPWSALPDGNTDLDAWLIGLVEKETKFAKDLMVNFPELVGRRPKLLDAIATAQMNRFYPDKIPEKDLLEISTMSKLVLTRDVDVLESFLLRGSNTPEVTKLLTDALKTKGCDLNRAFRLVNNPTLSPLLTMFIVARNILPPQPILDVWFTNLLKSRTTEKYKVKDRMWGNSDMTHDIEVSRLKLDGDLQASSLAVMKHLQQVLSVTSWYDVLMEYDAYKTLSMFIARYIDTFERIRDSVQLDEVIEDYWLGTSIRPGPSTELVKFDWTSQVKKPGVAQVARHSLTDLAVKKKLFKNEPLGPFGMNKELLEAWLDGNWGYFEAISVHPVAKRIFIAKPNEVIDLSAIKCDLSQYLVDVGKIPVDQLYMHDVLAAMVEVTNMFHNVPTTITKLVTGFRKTINLPAQMSLLADAMNDLSELMKDMKIRNHQEYEHHVSPHFQRFSAYFEQNKATLLDRKGMTQSGSEGLPEIKIYGNRQKTPITTIESQPEWKDVNDTTSVALARFAWFDEVVSVAQEMFPEQPHQIALDLPIRTRNDMVIKLMKTVVSGASDIMLEIHHNGLLADTGKVPELVRRVAVLVDHLSEAIHTRPMTVDTTPTDATLNWFLFYNTTHPDFGELAREYMVSTLEAMLGTSIKESTPAATLQKAFAQFSAKGNDHTMAEATMMAAIKDVFKRKVFTVFQYEPTEVYAQLPMLEGGHNLLAVRELLQSHAMSYLENKEDLFTDAIEVSVADMKQHYRNHVAKLHFSDEFAPPEIAVLNKWFTRITGDHFEIDQTSTKTLTRERFEALPDSLYKEFSLEVCNRTENLVGNTSPFKEGLNAFVGIGLDGWDALDTVATRVGNDLATSPVGKTLHTVGDITKTGMRAVAGNLVREFNKQLSHYGNRVKQLPGQLIGYFKSPAIGSGKSFKLPLAKVRELTKEAEKSGDPVPPTVKWALEETERTFVTPGTATAPPPIPPPIPSVQPTPAAVPTPTVPVPATAVPAPTTAPPPPSSPPPVPAVLEPISDLTTATPPMLFPRCTTMEDLWEAIEANFAISLPRAGIAPEHVVTPAEKLECTLAAYVFALRDCPAESFNLSKLRVLLGRVISKKRAETIIEKGLREPPPVVAPIVAPVVAPVVATPVAPVVTVTPAVEEYNNSIWDTIATSLPRANVMNLVAGYIYLHNILEPIAATLHTVGKLSTGAGHAIASVLAAIPAATTSVTGPPVPAAIPAAATSVTGPPVGTGPPVPAVTGPATPATPATPAAPVPATTPGTRPGSRLAVMGVIGTAAAAATAVRVATRPVAAVGPLAAAEQHMRQYRHPHPRNRRPPPPVPVAVASVPGEEEGGDLTNRQTSNVWCGVGSIMAGYQAPGHENR